MKKSVKLSALLMAVALIVTGVVFAVSAGNTTTVGGDTGGKYAVFAGSWILDGAAKGDPQSGTLSAAGKRGDDFTADLWLDMVFLCGPEQRANNVRIRSGSKSIDLFSVAKTGITFRPKGILTSGEYPVEQVVLFDESDYGYHHLAVQYHQGAAVNASDATVIDYTFTFTFYLDGVRLGEFAGDSATFQNTGNMLYGATIADGAIVPQKELTNTGKNGAGAASAAYYYFYNGGALNGADDPKHYIYFDRIYGSHGDTARISYLPIEYHLGGGELPFAYWEGMALKNMVNFNDCRNSKSIYTPNAHTYKIVEANHFFDPASETILPTPTRPGYRFDGWFTTEDFAEGTQVTATAAGATEGLSIYAKWTRDGTSVRYEMNGGAFADPAAQPVDVKWEGQTLVTDIPVRDGFTFLGWYTDPADAGALLAGAADGGKYTATVPSAVSGAEEITLYAAWQQTSVDVSYVLNGGAFAAPDEVPTKIDIYTQTLVTELPKRELHTFLGWYTASDLSGEPLVGSAGGGWYSAQVPGATLGAAPITLYAKWEQSAVSLSFALNGGTVSGSMPDEVEIAKKKVTISIPEKENYTLVGFFTESDLSGEPLAMTKIGNKLELSVPDAAVGVSQITLYAKWEQTATILRFELDGGSFPAGTAIPDSIAWGTTEVILPTPHLEGSDFIGWHLDPDFEDDAFLNERTFTVDSSVKEIVVYAEWMRTTGTIRFDTMGMGFAADAEVPDHFSLNEASSFLFPAISTAGGQVFLGWYDNSACAGVPYMPGDRFDITLDMLYADGVNALAFYAKVVTVGVNESFTSGNGGLNISKKDDASGTPGTVTSVNANGQLEWNKTLSTVDGPIEKSFVITQNKVVISFDIAQRDVGANGMPLTLRFLHRDAGRKDLFFFFTVGGDGTMSCGGKTIGMMKETMQNVTYFMTIDGTNVEVDIYLDGVLVVDGHSVTTSETLLNTKLFYWYLETRAVGVTMLDNFYLAQGAHVSNYALKEGTLHFDTNGGELPADAPSKYGTSTATPLPTPTMEGLTFLGWYFTPDFSGKGYTEIPANSGMQGDVTLYARWNATVIGYDAEGATLGGEYDAILHDDAAEIKLPLATKTGFAFFGWYTTPDFSGTCYTDKISASEYKKTGMLYAKFVSFEANLAAASPTQTGLSLTGFKAKSQVTTSLSDGMLVISKAGKPSAGESVWDFDAQFGVSLTNKDRFTLDFTYAMPEGETDALSMQLRLRFRKDLTNSSTASGNTYNVYLVTIAENGDVKLGVNGQGLVLGNVLEGKVNIRLIVDLKNNSVDAYRNGDFIVKGATINDFNSYCVPAALHTVDYYVGGNNTGKLGFERFAILHEDGGDRVAPTGTVGVFYHGTEDAWTTVGETTLTLPSVADTADKRFVGWYTNAAFTGEPVTEITAAGGKAPIHLYAKFEDIYSVTYSVSGVTNTLADKAASVTLADTAAYWVSSADGKVYPAGAVVSLSRDTTFYALTVDLIAGASIRLDEPTGLRFETKVDADMLAALASGGYTFRVGTLIAPTDKLGEGAFTAEALSAAGVAFLDLFSSMEDASDKSGYFATITEILAANYTRVFSAVSYIEVIVDGAPIRVYDDYVAADNSRSVYDVACRALAGYEAGTTQYATVKGFIDSVVTLDANCNVVAPEGVTGYTAPYTVSYAGGVLTITEGGATVRTIVIDGVAYTRGFVSADGVITVNYTASVE